MCYLKFLDFFTCESYQFMYEYTWVYANEDKNWHLDSVFVISWMNNSQFLLSEM